MSPGTSWEPSRTVTGKGDLGTRSVGDAGGRAGAFPGWGRSCWTGTVRTQAQGRSSPSLGGWHRRGPSRLGSPELSVSLPVSEPCAHLVIHKS